MASHFSVTLLTVSGLLAAAAAQASSPSAVAAAAAAAAAALAEGPCDIYASAGTPCIAAHSFLRAMFAAYDGPLYAVQRTADNATLNIYPVSPGGIADAAAQVAFCNAVPPPPPSVPPAGSVVRIVPSTLPTYSLRHCYAEA
jgi:non-reducing end alpha-L-arabinofuranosidase